jgi:phosphoglycerate dehydrogenase-like enzyme
VIFMTKPHVLCTFDPSPEQLRLAREILEPLGDFSVLPRLQGDARRKTLEEASVLLCKSFAPGEITPSEVDSLSRLTFVQLLFAGADNVPFRRIPQHVTVASNAGGFAEPLAEHVLAMALAQGKKLFPLHNRMREGFFDSSEESLFFSGKVCGIIGYGGNGRAMGRLFKALGMRVEGINRRGEPDTICDAMGTLEDLSRMLPSWDLVVLTLPLTKQTRSIIAAEDLKRMKSNAIFINVGRGALVDQEALYRHMKKHPEFLVGIDTWWSEPAHHGAFHLEYPLLELPNLLASPHRADHVREMEIRPLRKALENVAAYLGEQPLLGVLRREEYAS